MHGIKRRASLFNADRGDHRCRGPHVNNRRFKLHCGTRTAGLGSVARAVVSQSVAGTGSVWS